MMTMKAIIFFLAALGPASVTALPRDTATFMVRPENKVPQQQLAHARRNLQNSECHADTAAIFERSLALRQAARAFDPEYASAVQACDDNTSCTINEDDFAATPDFRRECEAAGGVIYEYDLVVNCSMSNGQEKLEVTISYLGVDHCYALHS